MLGTYMAPLGTDKAATRGKDAIWTVCDDVTTAEKCNGGLHTKSDGAGTPAYTYHMTPNRLVFKAGIKAAITIGAASPATTTGAWEWN